MYSSGIQTYHVPLAATGLWGCLIHDALYGHGGEQVPPQISVLTAGHRAQGCKVVRARVWQQWGGGSSMISALMAGCGAAAKPDPMPSSSGSGSSDAELRPHPTVSTYTSPTGSLWTRSSLEHKEAAAAAAPVPAQGMQWGLAAGEFGPRQWWHTKQQEGDCVSSRSHPPVTPLNFCCCVGSPAG